MFFNRKECSKTGLDVLEQVFRQFYGNFVPKVWKNMVAHRTPTNEPHAHTSRTLFRKDFARTRTRATANRTCACAHAPSQLIPCHTECTLQFAPLLSNTSNTTQELEKLFPYLPRHINFLAMTCWIVLLSSQNSGRIYFNTCDRNLKYNTN